MSREGWFVAIGACLLLVIVPLAMWSGLSPESRSTPSGQLPTEPEETTSETVEETSAEGGAEPTEVRGEGGAPTAAPRSIHGTVTDANGRPIAHARIHVEGSVEPYDETNEDGAFEIDDVSAGPAVLVAESLGYDETKTDVPATATEQDVVLAPSKEISGIVLHPDGKPTAGARVTCEGAPSSPTLTDRHGRFLLATINACDAVAQHPSFARSKSAKMAQGPQNLLTLRPLASIAGLVLDGRGAPYTGFVLSVKSFQPTDGTTRMRPYRQTFAHPQGRFRVTKLPAGRYVFNVGLRGRSRIETQPIVVKDGEQLTGVKIIVE